MCLSCVATDLWFVGWVTFVSINKCVWLSCHTSVMYGYGSLLSVGIRVFGCVITDMCGCTGYRTWVTWVTFISEDKYNYVTVLL